MSRSVLILFNAFLVLSGLLFVTLTIEYPDEPPFKCLIKPEDKIIPYHRKYKVEPAYIPYQESKPKRNPHGKMAWTMPFYVKFYYPNRIETKGFTVYATFEKAAMAPNNYFYDTVNVDKNPYYISIEDSDTKEVWYIPIFKG